MHVARFHTPFTRTLPWGCLALAALLCVPPTLRADETVRQVQEELRKRNLYFGDIDGRATPEVAAALRRYQSRKGFSATGALDANTLRSLIDESTLRSLNPRLAGLPASVEAPSAPTPWPDITVLRSDEARRGPTPPTDNTPAPAATALPTPGPPPAAAERRRPPGPDAIRAFLVRYLQAGQANDVPAELAFYADHVDFFDDGLVDRPFIGHASTGYDARWPQRQFTLLDPLTLSASPDGDPDKVVARFRYAFTNKGPRYTVKGEADNAFTIQRVGPDDFRLVGMKEERVRKNSLGRAHPAPSP